MTNVCDRDGTDRRTDGNIGPVGPKDAAIDVVYICSHSRSGSTLSGSVLGLVQGYCYVGEVRSVWTLGLTENHNCGCGLPFRDCPFWIQVFEHAFGGFDNPETHRLVRVFTKIHRRRTSLGLFRLVWRNHDSGRDIEEYTQGLARLYRAIVHVSKCRTIVDSSKSLRYAALLMRSPRVGVRLVNIIRDPRGIVHSRTRRARFRDGSEKPDTKFAGGYHVLRIIAKWVLRNWLCRRVMRHRGGVRALYEDFVEDQHPLISAVAGSVQADRIVWQLATEAPAGVVQHQVAGNWVRDLKISPNESWRSELPPAIAGATAVLSWPWRKRYVFETFD